MYYILGVGNVIRYTNASTNQARCVGRGVARVFRCVIQLTPKSLHSKGTVK